MSNYAYSSLTLCSQCNQYLSISLNKDKPKEILIQCDNCKYSSYTPINNYLNQIKNYSNLRNSTDNICNRHLLKCNYYCITCKLYICEECHINNHLSHEQMSLLDVIPTIPLTNKLSEKFVFINSYCNQLKINKINNHIFKINQLEHSYQWFKTINNDILTIMLIIVNNYYNNHYNYYLKKNIKNILSFINNNWNKCHDYTNDDIIIKYYNNYNLLKGDFVDITNINTIKTIDDHKDEVYSLLLLSDGRLASCSEDSTIKIFDIDNNYHCDITIRGHTSIISYISQLKDSRIVSCSWDKSIRIWRVTKSTYKCEYIIENAHNDCILKVIPLSNNRIASCSNDKRIKIWNSKYPYNLIKKLKGHIDFVYSIIQLKDKEILISGSRDDTLRKWNLLTYQCNTIINDAYCYNVNSIIEIDKNRVIVGGDLEIIIVDIFNDKIEKIIKNNKIENVGSLLKLRDGNILCGCEYGLICLIDIKMNSVIFKEDKIHNNIVYCLINLNQHQIISCSWDSTIKILEY